MPAVQKIIDSLKISPMPPCNFVENENVTNGGKCVLGASSSESIHLSYLYNKAILILTKNARYFNHLRLTTKLYFGTISRLSFNITPPS